MKVNIAGQNVGNSSNIKVSGIDKLVEGPYRQAKEHFDLLSFRAKFNIKQYGVNRVSRTKECVH
eukprot:15366170-Ditylum_brightwellii.AAC.1